jgi:hypothetical protein
MGAAPAPDFGWLQLRVDAEGKASTEINEIKDLLLEPAMGAERLVIEVERLKGDVEMAVDVVAAAEVHLRAPVTAKPLTEVAFGPWDLLALPASNDRLRWPPLAVRAGKSLPEQNVGSPRKRPPG